jgi:hypothetical protein
MSQRVYPVFRGLAFSLTKTPNWASRMQRAVSGRTLRTSDYVNPVWTFKLVYAVLHDFPWCSYTSPTELRTMMDFFNSSGGAFDAFLLDDPTDRIVAGQVLPAALSSVATVGVNNPGTNYSTGDQVFLAGGTGASGLTHAAQAAWTVASVTGGGGVTALTPINPGAYSIVPGTSGVATTTNGSGDGSLLLNVTWLTTVQLVRQLVPGGFAEAIIAPRTVINLYFGTSPQSGWTVDSTTGLVTLPNPFFSAQPVISADFDYYFRVYFPDALDFEEIYSGYYQIRQVKLTSVVL